MKIFNFSQNFDSTSNFQKSFKWTREHSRMPFWELQSTKKVEMKVLKSWSKSEISLRTAVIKIFNFWQNFVSTTNFQKSFKWTREHFKMPFCDLQFIHKSEMKVLKSWWKSEILLRTAVMKVFNFWQNFDSTSNFQKSFKWTRDHSRIPFWGLQFIHKSEMKVLKSWSKSEISLRTALIKIFNFWQNFVSTWNFQKSFKWTREHSKMPFCDLQFIHKSEMKVLKSWWKSEILLRTAVMKMFNFSQNFDSTSNFQKSFKWTRDHSRIPFWGLQSTYKAEMKVLKSWSKSEISLRTAVMKIFNFWQNFDSTSNFQKSFK